MENKEKIQSILKSNNKSMSLQSLQLELNVSQKTMIEMIEDVLEKDRFAFFLSIIPIWGCKEKL